MLIGIGVAVLVFLFEYSNSRTINIVSRPSNGVRSYHQRQQLASQQGAVVAIRLYGSSMAISSSARPCASCAT